MEAQATAWDLRLDSSRRDLLLEFARLLASYDRANVIGTRDLGDVVLGHVLDSLSCFLYEPLSSARRFADVGSGGGLPGIPVKIVRPDLPATLMESTGKKARFLQYAIDVLSLDGVEVANARAEELGRDQDHRETYDVVSARAVARLSVVAEYCVPLLRIGGSVISMKGRLEADELSEGSKGVAVLGARVAEVIRVPMLAEVGEKERSLVILEKVRETPARYPRRPGVAGRKPLGVG